MTKKRGNSDWGKPDLNAAHHNGPTGDGTNGNGHQAELLASMPGIVQEENGELHFAEWNCRAGQNNVIICTDGTVAPCFPMYGQPSTGETSISPSSTRANCLR